MKYLKMLGLAAIAAGALMAFAGAGTASAAHFTCTRPAGTIVVCFKGTAIHAVSEGHVVLDALAGKIECNSTIQGATENEGSSTETVRAGISTLNFTGCTGGSATVLKAGTIEVHAISGTSNGTLTLNGTEITTESAGVHCIFSTNNTDIGTLTGSRVTANGHATIDVSATIPRTGGRSGAFCGTSAPWTGSYEIELPELESLFWFEICF